MLLENCCFDRFELLSESLVRAGKLGEVVNCHGAYAHVRSGRRNGAVLSRFYPRKMGNEKAAPRNRTAGV